MLSEQYLQAALTIGRKYKISAVAQSSLTNLGNLYLTKGQPEKALPYLQDAQSPQWDVGMYSGITSLALLGETYYRLNNYPEAKRCLESALAMAKQVHSSRDIFEIHLRLATLFGKMGDHTAAYTHEVQYAAYKDSFNSINISKEINQLEVKYRTAQKDKEISENALTIAHQQENIQRKNKWIWITSSAIFLLFAICLFLLLLYRNNRHIQQMQGKQLQILKQEQEINLLKAVMEGGENERFRIARDLHDGIGGMLAAIKMNLSSIGNGNEKIHKVMKMVEDTAGEVRKTSHNLMPDILTRQDLADALQLYCEQIGTSGQIKVQLGLYGNFSQLNKSVQLVIYRIIQELLQNTLKHAKATEAHIELEQRENRLNIIAEDNGIGFNTDHFYEGFGLQNLKYRIQSLQGTLSLEAAEGVGTTVLIEFELDKLQNSFT